MTVHFAPIPKCKYLVKALFASPSNGNLWLSEIPGGSVHLYSRGLYALADGVKIILGNRGKNEGKVWLPDYFCKEPLILLRNNNIFLDFYPIKEDLSPDWDAIENDIRKTSLPDIFILVHYFGFSNQVDKARVFCDTYKIDLLEDAAHMLLPSKGMGQSVVIFSPRKYLPIPEGGVLYIPERFTDNSTEDVSNSCKYKMVSKWIVRRLTQRIMLIFHIPWHKFKKFLQRGVNNNGQYISGKNSDAFPDKYTLRLLSLIEQNLDNVIEKRRENYVRLCQAVNGIKGVRILFPTLQDKVCPYMFPIIVEEGTDLIKRRLQYLGIPASSWPDLPDEVLETKDEHESAIWLREHILLLPIHQDLSEKQMEHFATVVSNVLRECELVHTV
jgi:hypothetical protein